MNLIQHIEGSLDRDPDLYKSAEPFPHIVIDNFLPSPVINSIVEVFPRPDELNLERAYPGSLSIQTRVE